MRPPLLDARLSAAFDMVRAGSVAADVGTDHGHLPLHLILSGKCTEVYAIDARAKPLEKARALAARFGFNEEIHCVLGDGLSQISAGMVSDVVIAGMGGVTIMGIINAAPWLQDEGVRLVLVPASNIPLLRRELCEAGFEIQREQAVEAAGRFYTVMQAAFSGVRHTPSELFCQVGKVAAKTPQAEGYIKKAVSLLEDEVQGKTGNARFDVSEKTKLLTQLQGVLKECQE